MPAPPQAADVTAWTADRNAGATVDWCGTTTAARITLTHRYPVLAPTRFTWTED